MLKMCYNNIHTLLMVKAIIGGSQPIPELDCEKSWLQRHAIIILKALLQMRCFPEATTGVSFSAMERKRIDELSVNGAT